MMRALRLLMAVFLLVSLGFAGGTQAAFANPASHAAMADCPHELAAGTTQPGAPHHSGTATPTSACCYALPSIGLPAAGYSAAPPLLAASPRPALERLPLGASPGPELPPPRA